MDPITMHFPKQLNIPSWHAR